MEKQKRLFLQILTCVFVFTGCANAQKESDISKKVSILFQESYNQENYEGIFELYSDNTKKALPLPKTTAFLNQVKTNFGAIKSLKFEEYSKTNFAIYKAATEKAPLSLHIATNSNSEITGYLIKPYQSKKGTKKDNAFILDFIKKNPGRSSIKIVQNNNTIVSVNPNKMMPLASTVKLILAIEYAEQASKKMIDPNEMVSLNELELFYLPNTDGGAHSKWLEHIKSKISKNKISIKEITKGMIMFSSNANTEWLSEKLGLENINKRLDLLKIKNHTEIYYLVSSILIPHEKFPNLKDKKLEEALKKMSRREYIEITHLIHKKLHTNPSYKNMWKETNDMAIQKIWSDRLPASTTSEYVSLMKKINSRTYFSENTQTYLDEILEFLLENPANQKWLKHTGAKGGSTAFVLTKALYATDKKGKTTEVAYFFNNLSFKENRELQKHTNTFDLNLLSNESYLKIVKKRL